MHSGLTAPRHHHGTNPLKGWVNHSPSQWLWTTSTATTGDPRIPVAQNVLFSTCNTWHWTWNFFCTRYLTYFNLKITNVKKKLTKKIIIFNYLQRKTDKNCLEVKKKKKILLPSNSPTLSVLTSWAGACNILWGRHHTCPLAIFLYSQAAEWRYKNKHF